MTLDGEHRSPPGKDVGAAVPGQGGGEGDALRVVAFSDALLDDEVDAAGLVRRAASYAGCPVGIGTAADRVVSTRPHGPTSRAEGPSLKRAGPPEVGRCCPG